MTRESGSVATLLIAAAVAGTTSAPPPAVADQHRAGQAATTASPREAEASPPPARATRDGDGGAVVASVAILLAIALPAYYASRHWDQVARALGLESRRLAPYDAPTREDAPAPKRAAEPPPADEPPLPVPPGTGGIESPSPPAGRFRRLRAVPEREEPGEEAARPTAPPRDAGQSS